MKCLPRVMEGGDDVELLPTTKSKKRNVILTEIQKLHGRFESFEKTMEGRMDAIDDKVSDMYNVYSRIKQEANYRGRVHKRAYHPISTDPQSITNQEEEEEEEEEDDEHLIDDNALWRLFCCCCCTNGK